MLTMNVAIVACVIAIGLAGVQYQLSRIANALEKKLEQPQDDAR